MFLPYESVCFLLNNFRTRFPNEISCFLAVMRYPYEICRVLLHLSWRHSVLLGRYEGMRCSCEILCFLRHTFRMRYPDEISCCFGPLRALRMRLRACSTVKNILDEISCFLAAQFSFWWCDVRTLEVWMLKDAGDWVYKMVYRTLRGFVSAGWVVRWLMVIGASASALGNRGVCVEVVWFVSSACITSNQYVFLRMP